MKILQRILIITILLHLVLNMQGYSIVLTNVSQNIECPEDEPEEGLTREQKWKQFIDLLTDKGVSSKEYNTFWKREQANKNKSDAILKILIFERDLENGLHQKLDELHFGSDIYHFNIIMSKEQVIYLHIYESMTVKKAKTKFEYFDDKVYPNLIFSNEMDYPTTVNFFGIACSYDGTPPKICKLMQKLVKDNNVKKLRKWLYSLNPEIAVYGYLGFCSLELKGKEIGTMDKKRMEIVRTSTIPLYTCSGCFYGEMIPTNDILSSKWMEDFYNKLSKK